MAADGWRREEAGQRPGRGHSLQQKEAGPMTQNKRAYRAAALVSAFSLLGQPLAPAFAAGRQAAAKPATTAAKPAGQASAKPAAATAAAPATPIDGGWPRMYGLASGGTILVYQ